jgi:uncharacterized protein
MKRMRPPQLVMLVTVSALLSLLDGCEKGGGDVSRLEKATKDPQAYAAQVDAECGAGRAASCTAVGTQLAFGTFGRPKDPTAAAPFLEKGCGGGDPQGCHELGVLYEYGRGVGKDGEKAKVLYAKACAGGLKTSCGR